MATVSDFHRKTLHIEWVSGVILTGFLFVYSNNGLLFYIFLYNTIITFLKLNIFIFRSDIWFNNMLQIIHYKSQLLIYGNYAFIYN